MNIYKKKRKNPKCTVFVRARKESTPFTESLDSLTAEQIPLRRSSVARTSLSSMFLSASRYALLTLSLLVFIASCTMLVMFAADSARATSENERYQDIFYGQTNIVSIDRTSRENIYTLSFDRVLDGEKLDIDYGSTGEIYNEEFEKTRSRLLALKRSNPDVWGWISVPGTPIEYPIMFSGDNEYYLRRTPSKQESKDGSIFADGRTEEHLEDNRNLIIYGHNIAETPSQPRKMFSYLLDFTREDKFKNGTVVVSTLDGIYTYEIFSIYSTTADYNYIKTYFSTDSSFVRFANSCKNLSMYSKDIDINENDKILTLSTCTNQRNDKRWAVHCKLIGISK